MIAMVESKHTMVISMSCCVGNGGQQGDLYVFNLWFESF